MISDIKKLEEVIARDAIASKKTIGNVIGKTKVSVLSLDRVEFIDRLERLYRLESSNRLDCLVRIE